MTLGCKDVEAMMDDQWALRDMAQFNTLSSGAKDVLGQLFLKGPTWDGDVISKNGRDELCRADLAFHVQGWASLTETGCRMASYVDVRSRHDQRWYRKQNQLLSQ